MYTYDTVTAAIKGLKQRGYNIDFNLEAGRLFCHDAEDARAEGQTLDRTPSLLPHEFEITEVYRFEGDSDPADEAAVYAIESKKGQKGVLVTGFGISAEGVGEEMIEKLSIRHQ